MKLIFLLFIFFSESNDGNGDFICHAQLPDGPEITGYGKNKWLAKYDACRKAMNHY